MITQKKELIAHIVKELKSFTDIAVVSMSGGADSTLVAILCTLALGKENVYSLHMPMNDHDERTFNDRSHRTATKLGIHKSIIPITAVADAITKSIQTHFAYDKPLSQLNLGNARSRARTTIAYGVCTHLGETLKKRARVIGTGNLSEDFIGYDTKGGDALCDIFPIGELFKSEVYELLDGFKKEGVIDESMIDRIPSAGLWDGQTDEKELGYSYNDMEKSIRKIRQAKGVCPTNPTNVDQFVFNRHLAHKHKHEAAIVLSLRPYCD